jgi:hypothetical protein
MCQRRSEYFIMSRFFVTGIVTLGLIGAVGLGMARAQITGPVTFTTTFPFTVGRTSLPAGSYMLRPVGPENTDQALLITGATNHKGAMFLTERTSSTTPAKQSDISFVRYGDHYFLKNIEIAGEDDGAEAVMTRDEAREAHEHPMKATHKVAAFIGAPAQAPTAAPAM